MAKWQKPLVQLARSGKAVSQQELDTLVEQVKQSPKVRYAAVQPAQHGKQEVQVTERDNTPHAWTFPVQE